jgi:DNA-binding beta-propeller fold protein YncE
MKINFVVGSLVVVFTGFVACTKEKVAPDYRSYPIEVGEILVNKCAVSGCHNQNSKAAAGGLNLDSWNSLFEGGRNSACVIPFRSDFSTLHYYVNTFTDLGPALTPTMPYNKTPLSRQEVITLKTWIDKGAPNVDGVVKFADNPNRKKSYVINQGCDVVTVLDNETQLPMRYITIGNSATIESPHMVRVSPDGQYWYVIFLNSIYMEKYRTSDDAFVGKINLGSGNWNSFCISSNSRYAFVIDWSTSGKIASVDLQNMTSTPSIGWNLPHGSALNSTNDTLYVTQQVNSSKVYKIPVNDFSSYAEINLFTTAPAQALNPHEIRFTPDGSKYFVTCQGTNEVRIFSTQNDVLLASIPVGAMPSEMSFSTSTPYVFVTCTEDFTSFPGKRGSVAVLDYENNVWVTTLYTGHQPHGIEVDDVQKTVLVINRNFTNDGPAPHHSSECGGRNGNISFINLQSLTMMQNQFGGIKKIEIASDPYSVSIKQ